MGEPNFTYIDQKESWFIETVFVPYNFCLANDSIPTQCTESLSSYRIILSLTIQTAELLFSVDLLNLIRVQLF